MLKNLANCRNCQLYSNQLPLIDKKEDVDIIKKFLMDYYLIFS